MGDTLITIIAIFLAAVLMFIVPLMSVSERNDDIAQIAVQTAVSEFVDKVSVSGSIKKYDYEELQTKIAATGNTYDIEIEVQHLDENPGKKTSIASPDLIGENVRYSTFTTEIIPNVYNNSNGYNLKQGDNVIVTVKNTNITLAQTLRSFAYKVVGKGTSQIVAGSASMVVNSGQ